MAPPADKKKTTTGTSASTKTTKKETKPAQPKKTTVPEKEKTKPVVVEKTKPIDVKVEKKKPAAGATAPATGSPAVGKKLEKPKAPSTKKQAPKTVKKEEKKVKQQQTPLKGKSAILNKKKKVSTKFVIDCTLPAEDQLFNSTDFEKFLKEKIKIQGKTGALGSNIMIERGDKNSKLIINANIPLSKRYLKYLTKKYLKKMMLRDTLRVISTSRDTYELRYFQIGNDADDDDDEDNA